MIENSLISWMNGFGFSGFGRIALFSGQTALAQQTLRGLQFLLVKWLEKSFFSAEIKEGK